MPVSQYLLQIIKTWKMQLRATQSTLWAHFGALYGQAQRSLIEHTENTQTTEQINKQVQKLNNYMSERTHVPRRSIAIFAWVVWGAGIALS